MVRDGSGSCTLKEVLKALNRAHSRPKQEKLMCLSFYQNREAVWAERRTEENKLVAFLAFCCAEDRSHASVSVNIHVPKSKS